MAHIHSVYDTDTHFQINKNTREIKNVSTSKTTITQFDHNSERFTFEIPRFIDGHDMSLCNKVQVHYINIDATNKVKQNVGVYTVDDLQISPEDENIVICSWLISQGATQLAGPLTFLLRYACITDGVLDYAWNTARHTSISVSNGIYNGEAIIEEYSDILAEWEHRIELLEGGLPVKELTEDVEVNSEFPSGVYFANGVNVTFVSDSYGFLFANSYFPILFIHHNLGDGKFFGFYQECSPTEDINTGYMTLYDSESGVKKGLASQEFVESQIKAAKEYTDEQIKEAGIQVLENPNIWELDFGIYRVRESCCYSNVSSENQITIPREAILTVYEPDLLGKNGGIVCGFFLIEENSFYSGEISKMEGLVDGEGNAFTGYTGTVSTLVKSTAISENSTDKEFASAKAVYNAIQEALYVDEGVTV